MVAATFGRPCCFCGEPIERTAPDPCAIRVETREGLTQAWFFARASKKMDRGNAPAAPRR